MQWRGLSQRLQFLGIEWGRRGWGQPCTYPLHRDLQPTLVPSDHRNSPALTQRGWQLWQGRAPKGNILAREGGCI